MKVIHMNKLSALKHTFDGKYKKFWQNIHLNVNTVKVHYLELTCMHFADCMFEVKCLLSWPFISSNVPYPRRKISV